MTKIIALTICFMFVGVGSIFAEPSQLQIQLVYEISHITYEEPLMKEKGFMGGIAGSLAYHNNLMLKAEGRLSGGLVNYDGHLANGTPCTIDYIPDYMLEFRGLGGYDFPILTATILTPYIGFGYRYLNDDSSFDPSGYERESNYYYSPIGVETITELKGWSIGATIEYDYFWKGIQKSHLSDSNPGLSDAKNDQKGGYGWRGSIKFQKNRLIIEPFIRYWDIDKSEVQDITYYGTYYGYAWEPKNNSTEIGIKIEECF